MRNKRNYNEWTKEELVKELEVVTKLKTYGLNWEREKTKEIFDYYINWEGEKTKEIFKGTEDKFPIIKELKEKTIVTEENQDNNVMIVGDNYHALAVLNFTHEKSIDVIYIDPPYNTGKKDFKYNDQWVDKEDGYRHSKWLTFMEKRLKLARSLLKDTGIIIISIDDNEYAQLKLLCDQIFLESNYIATLPTIMNLKGNQDQFGFAGTHEYTLIYARNKQKAEIGHFPLEEEEMLDWEEDEYGYYKKGANLKSSGVNAPREKRPNLFYPVLYKQGNEYVETIPEEEHKRLYDKETKKFDDEYLKKLREKYEKQGYLFLLPQSNVQYMTWRWQREKIESEPYNIIINNNGLSFSIYKKQRPSLTDLPSKKPKTIFYKPEYSSGNGTNLLKGIFGKKVFNNPKPLELIKDLLLLTTNKGSVVLDFFAGTGITAHAVLELNKEDGGKRKYILCTNNEDNDETGLKIATDICYPRLEKIIHGYKDNKGNKIKALGSNLKYFQTDFVGSVPTDKNKKIIVDKSTEMLCLKENAFNRIKEDVGYKIFKNSKIFVGIIYDEESIERFIQEAKNITGAFHVYVFSLDDNVPEYDFEEIKDRVTLCPIPEIILHIYRKIFKYF